jgi:PAS domain S-box-containing protein
MLEKKKKKKAEAKDWKEMYKSLVKASPDAVTMTDLEGKIIDVSQHTLELHGFSRSDELLGKKAFALIAPSDRKKAARNMELTFKTGHSGTVAYNLLRKDGTRFIGELNASLVKDEKGSPKAYIATTRDITERRQEELALKRSEERYKSLFTLGPQAVVTVNMKGLITSCNPMTQQLTGFMEKELVGKNVFKLRSILKKDIPRFRDILLLLKKGKFPDPVECKYYHKDGRAGWAFVRVGLFNEGQGKKGIQAVVTDITELKKVMGALYESEERYKSLFDRSLFCVYVHDFEGRFLDANKAALDLLGYKKDEISSINFATLLDEEQVPLAHKTMKEIRKRDRQTKPTEYKIQKKNGDTVWVETEASLIFKEGNPYAILGIARDITENKRAETALKEREKKYRKIFESLFDVYYRTDREGMITEISPSVRTQAGYDPEDVIGHPVTDFYRDPSAREVFAQNLKETGRVNDYELQLMAKDGRVIEVSVSSHIVTDREGNPVGVEGVLRDISARKRAEQALKESEEKYRKMVEHSLQGIVIVQDFRIVYCNEAFARITGYSVEELMSFPPGKVKGLVHPDDQALVWGRLANRLLGKDVPARYEYRGLRKDGRIVWIEMIANSVEYQGKPAVQGAVIDISEHKEAEKRIKASLEEKEVMLREIHHRVKNNMQIILSLLRIQSRVLQDEKTVEMFRQSQNRIKSMALIHEALYKSGDLAKIDFSDYINRMTTHLLSLYRQDLGEVSVKQETEGIYLDINRAIPCGLIISELVSNSLKHAFPNKGEGRIFIRMSQNKDGKYTLIVKDTGVGYPDEKDLHETETLGMQLVTDLVQQLKGTIKLKRGAGAEFVVKF